MPLSLADVLSAQAGGGPVYEGGPDANLTLGGVLTAVGLGGPSWLDAAQKQTGADIAAYQRGGVPELMADTGQTQELASGFVGSTTPAKGIRAYHSSPYDFEKFDISKIGTGQGAQSYGHGLYAAENPAVSGQGGTYWNEFLQRFQGTPELEAAKILRNNNFDRAAAVQEAEGIVKHYDDKYSRDMLNLLQSGKPVGPRTYEVNINAEPGQFLNWDAPLSQQSSAVQRLAGVRATEANDPVFGRVGFAPRTGSGVYEELARKRPNPNYDPNVDLLGPQTILSHAGASRELLDAGIPGIRYLDQGSRIGSDQVFQVQSPKFPFNETEVGKWAIPGRNDVFPTREAAIASLPDKTSNYVVFNPEIVDILKKYGLAGLTMGGVLTAAGQEPAPSQ